MAEGIEGYRHPSVGSLATPSTEVLEGTTTASVSELDNAADRQRYADGGEHVSGDPAFVSF